MARLATVSEEPKRRQPGSTEGRIWVAEDLDAPLPEEVQKFFEQSEFYSVPARFRGKSMIAGTFRPMPAGSPQTSRTSLASA